MKLMPFSRNSYTDDTYFIIDDDDFEKVSAYKWRVHRSYSGRDTKKYPNYIVARRALKVERDAGSPHTITLHRFVLGIHLSYAKENQEVDHINRKTFDNRKSNLRLVTKAENQRNKCNNSGQGLGLWGATFNKGLNSPSKWQANFHVKGKTYMCGIYMTEAEAHESAKNKYKEITGKDKI